jgi:hypothetical protein
MHRPSSGESWVNRLFTQQCTVLGIHCVIHQTDNFETASLPTTSPEDRKRLLSFVVCGGGPTGVETAAVSFAVASAFFIADANFVLG